MGLDGEVDTTRSRTPSLAVAAAALVALVATVVPAGADTELPAEAQLEEARQRRVAVEERLATRAGDLEGLEEQVHAAEEELAVLDQRDARLQSELDEVQEALSRRSRLLFMRGDTTSLHVLLSSRDFSEVADGAALLESLALRDRASMEEGDALRVELATTRDVRAARLGELEVLRADLQEQLDQLLADLEQLQRDEERFGEQLRRQREELKRQREAEERRRRAAAAVDDAVASGGLACPVGEPVVFSDTWGAPRSGGRRHQGVDMMAPHGTPVYAITSGRITRMTGNRLGGISLYMYGDDGNQYYYTHLQGYAAGVGTGDRVGAGTHIAYVGSTGNASASAPHLHLEVHPGGGGAVNPYPYAARACGR